MLETIVTGMADRLLDKLLAHRLTDGEASTLQALLVMELCRNLGLLETLDFDTPDQWAPAFVAVSRELSSEALAAAFLPGTVNDALRERLNALKLPISEQDGPSPRDSLRSLYLRTDAVRTLARIGNPLPGMRAVQLRTRLQNLRTSMERLLAVLGQDRPG